MVETCERWRYVLARKIQGQSFPVGRRYQRSRLRPPWGFESTRGRLSYSNEFDVQILEEIAVVRER